MRAVILRRTFGEGNHHKDKDGVSGESSQLEVRFNRKTFLGFIEGGP